MFNNKKILTNLNDLNKDKLKTIGEITVLICYGYEKNINQSDLEKMLSKYYTHRFINYSNNLESKKEHFLWQYKIDKDYSIITDQGFILYLMRNNLNLLQPEEINKYIFKCYKSYLMIIKDNGVNLEQDEIDYIYNVYSKIISKINK